MVWLRVIFALCFGMLFSLSASYADEENQTDATAPVNRVDIDEALVTSGQPSAAYLATLAGQGFELVVNLAPPQSHGSLQNEGGLVAGTGLVYVNIPVDWDAPDPEHFEIFADILSQDRSRKTLVHCQVGFRASTFAFLYRVIHLKHAADEALESVHSVWVPNATWTAFAESVLDANGVDFSLSGG